MYNENKQIYLIHLLTCKSNKNTPAFCSSAMDIFSTPYLSNCVFLHQETLCGVAEFAIPSWLLLVKPRLVTGLLCWVTFWSKALK
jgi:hypothetical protein